MRLTIQLTVCSMWVALGTSGARAQTAENTAAACRDQADNDQDGYVDCADQDCGLFVFCGDRTGTASGADVEAGAPWWQSGEPPPSVGESVTLREQPRPPVDRSRVEADAPDPPPDERREGGGDQVTSVGGVLIVAGILTGGLGGGLIYKGAEDSDGLMWDVGLGFVIVGGAALVVGFIVWLLGAASG